ncbi:hypothetical protein PMI14_06855 [Acidovorax sp. CF316]|nr:hypothetical protein PMI14_06855 [Acidovorax sp. CF316]
MRRQAGMPGVAQAPDLRGALAAPCVAGGSKATALPGERPTALKRDW